MSDGRNWQKARLTTYSPIRWFIHSSFSILSKPFLMTRARRFEFLLAGHYDKIQYRVPVHTIANLKIRRHQHYQQTHIDVSLPGLWLLMLLSGVCRLLRVVQTSYQVTALSSHKSCTRFVTFRLGQSAKKELDWKSLTSGCLLIIPFLARSRVAVKGRVWER